MSARSIDVPRVATAELTAELVLDGDHPTLRMRGTADTRAYEDLDGMLKRLHHEALRAAIQEVVVDLRELEFMNSSCFKAFVTWLSDLSEVDSARQYRIRFRSDAKKHWQRRSLRALSCFAVDLVQVEST